MRPILRPGIRRLFRLPLRTPADTHDDVDQELDALIAARVDALVARGLSADAAHAEAMRHLGTTVEDARAQLHLSAEHRERRMRLSELLDSVTQDIRYAARGLVRRPAFTALAVATLAIGVGATTAIFSAVNALLLRPLPFPDPDALVKVTLVTPPRRSFPSNDQMVWSYPKFVVFRDAQHVFSDLAVYASAQVTLTSGDVERVRAEDVGATYLRTLGLTPLRGRDFDRAVDASVGARHEVLISEALWQSRFAADPSIVGKTIDIDRSPYTIIGVTPRGFGGLTGGAQLFLPVTSLSPDNLNEPQSHWLWLVARRAPGVSLEQAANATATLGVRVNDAIPNSLDKAKWGAKAAPLNDARLAPAVEQSLLVLFGAVGLVLLIACVNVANLLLGRASARRREIAVRVAIGAGRRRLVRLLLTESLLLALIGAAASLAVAWVGVHALGTINPATTLGTRRDTALGAVAFSSIALDWTALAFTLGVSLVVGVLFGLVPALGTTRDSLTDALKGDRPTHGFAQRVSLGRRSLVVIEVTLALVLLAGSGLMLRSLSNLLSTDTGFDASHVVTFRLALPPGAVDRDSMPGFYAELLDRVRAVPGVSDASINNCAPLSGGCSVTVIDFLDHPQADFTKQPLVGVHWASPSWFSTMHVPLVRGRGFANTDRNGTPKVLIVSEAAATRFWPGADPIGKHVSIGQGGMDDAEVIGIVRGVRQTADSAAGPEVYIDYAQSPHPGMIVFVRSTRNPASLGPDLRRVVRDVAPQFPIYDMQTMDARAAGATAQARFRALLLALFASTALLLAVVGIYGVISLGVTSRWRELGIRVALGADRGRMLRLVVAEGVSLVAVGAIVGLVGALLTTRVLTAFLFGVTASDPITYLAVVAVLALAAITASWIPARRAAHVDPVEALRAD